MNKNTPVNKLHFLFLLFFIPINSANAQDGCWKQATTGQYFTAAIQEDGTLWAWGYIFGTDDAPAPLNSNVPVQLGNSNNWKLIEAGGGHILGIRNDGTLWSVGNNGAGQLGNGTYVDSAIPIQIGTSNNWKTISTTVFSSTGLQNDGTLWTWGSNMYGELGNGSDEYYNIPTQIGNSTDWVQISGNAGFVLAIKADGTLWSWGQSTYGGELGNGMENSLVVNPTQVGTSNNWKQVSAGFSHCIGIKDDGTLWAWGQNDYYFGNGLPNDSYVPIQINDLTDWKEVKAGEKSTSAIKNDGSLWVWGENTAGQLGLGNNADVFFPLQSGNETNWSGISRNIVHATVIQSDGSLFCFGGNTYGQLGNGLNQNNNLPQPIACQTLRIGLQKILEFSIYPNPASELLFIGNPQNVVIDKINITDFSGKIVLEKNGNDLQVNISGLSSGIYMLNIYSQTKVQHEKFLKL